MPRHENYRDTIPNSGEFRSFPHNSPGYRAMIEKYIEDIAVDSRCIQKELGFKPLYDFAAGWKETVQEMRRAGAL